MIRLAWLEARPSVQIIFLMRFLAAVTLTAVGFGMRSVAGVVCWAAVVAAIYLHNGATDVVEDRCNESRRPVASGRLPAAAAERLARGLAGFGLVAGLFAPAPVLPLALAMLALGWLYSSGPFPMKRTVPGFLLVVVLGGVLTYAAGAASGGGGMTPELVFFGLAMSSWMGIAGSTKDLSDVAGDRAAGRRTLPVLLGRRRCDLVLAAGVLVLGVTATSVSLRLVPAMLPVACVLLAGAALVVALLLGHRPGRERHPYRAFMVTQYCAHLVVFASVG